ncbi:MAG: flagellar FliJ family protein [Synergistaceae bacterium]|jgi:flagellar export protein FliJ|nr:flagellar FliJ family protein [Synergistaceae bacterium]
MANELNRFRRVLHVREVEREITQGELATKMREEESILDRLNEIKAKRESALTEFCSGRDCLVSPQQIWFERQNLDLIEKRLGEDKHDLEDCRAQIEETKGVLLEKHRNVQIMEHFVDKLKVRQGKKAVDDEQNNLDDINSMRYRRNMNEEARF